MLNLTPYIEDNVKYIKVYLLRATSLQATMKLWYWF